MKKQLIFVFTILLSLATVFKSYSASATSNTNPPDEFETLVNYIEASSNFLKSELPIIMASEVKDNMKNPKYHIIDIRNDSWFEYGHIKGAVNVKAETLLSYFQGKIKPTDFDKIVLVCYSGQSAAFYSGLLRLAGYSNVYSMKWGMSSWREDFANNAWNKNIANDYASKIESIEVEKKVKNTHPILKTGKTEGKDILMARLAEVFAKPYNELIVKPTEIFEKPSNFYIINYWDQNKCQGHLTGAIHYTPEASLANDLMTLPSNEKIVVYEATGQKAAYIVAYLNVLGYNAGNLAYGENSFMNSLLKENGMDAFTKKEINMYPVIE
ncbi:rhodanese-like domain-containing protein [Mariniflexile sp.]|uniref:rhodanese-like domain-containing protein n=1 Tax=Mariniflexile sp. TaxID=1979402 RepID=UPI00356A1C01